MSLDDESWYVVRNTPGVTGFVSSEDEREKRPKPMPLEDKEVEAILSQIESGPPKVQVGFQKGQMVRIAAGPFADFIGAVSDIDASKGKMRVLVSFFGRETPVELDFLQVEKI
jgi:transcriptional antiterminator NusG